MLKFSNTIKAKEDYLNKEDDEVILCDMRSSYIKLQSNKVYDFVISNPKYTLNETIFNGKMIKLYLDIEHSTRPMDEVVKKAIETVNADGYFDCSITSACRVGKQSYHIVFNDMLFSSMTQMLAYVNCRFGDEDGVDKQVYCDGRQLFRIPLTTKNGNTETIHHLVNSELRQIKNEKTKREHFIKMLITANNPSTQSSRMLDLIEGLQLDKKEDALQPTTRKTTKPVNLRLIKHILDNLPEEYYTDGKLWRDVGFALESARTINNQDKLFELWDEFSQKADEAYNATDVANIFKYAAKKNSDDITDDDESFAECFKDNTRRKKTILSLYYMARQNGINLFIEEEKFQGYNEFVDYYNNKTIEDIPLFILEMFRYIKVHNTQEIYIILDVHIDGEGFISKYSAIKQKKIKSVFEDNHIYFRNSKYIEYVESEEIEVPKVKASDLLQGKELIADLNRQEKERLLLIKEAKKTKIEKDRELLKKSKDSGRPTKHYTFLEVIKKYTASLRVKDTEFLPTSGPLIESTSNLSFNFFSGFRAANLSAIKKYNEDEGGKEGLELVLNHIKMVLAGGDDGLYDYIIRWFAHILQFPHIKTSTCLVFTSRQGAGKNIIFNFIGTYLFGREYFASYNRLEQITGKFNANNAQKIFSLVDECTHYDEKGYSGIQEILKNQITEEWQVVEKKGIDSVCVPVYNNLILLSNNKNVVKVDEGNRRYVICRCSDTYAKNGDNDDENEKYFDKLGDALNKETGQALYKYLMGITVGNIRKIPKSNETLDDKLGTLKLIPRWIYEEYGIIKRDIGLNKNKIDFTMKELFTVFTTYAMANGIRHDLNTVKLSKLVIPFITSSRKVSNMARYVFDDEKVIKTFKLLTIDYEIIEEVRCEDEDEDNEDYNYGRGNE